MWGTANQPFATIAKAVSVAQAEDTIELAAGTYTQALVNVPANVTVQGSGAVVLQPTTAEYCASIPAHNITLLDLIFDGTNADDGGLSVTGDNFRMAGCTVRNCVVGDPRVQGLLASGVNGLTIEDCTFDNIIPADADQYNFSHALYINHGCRNVTIRRNTITNVSGHGVHIWSETGDAGVTSVVEQNYCAAMDRGIGVYEGTTIIRNNIVRDTTLAALFVRTHIVSALVAHNTCIGTPQAFIDVRNPGGALLSVRNNIHQGIVTEGDVTTADNLQTPSVVDNGGDDVTLTVRQTGAYLADVPTDYAGATRADPPTIGAHE